jgi:hypothetical protein
MGVAALWKSANPSMTPEDFGMIVHQSASDRGAIPGKEDNWGAGVIDAEAGLYRALSIHRVDFQPAWSVEHSTAGPALHLAVDGVPSSIAAILVGLSRTPVSIGGVVVGVGPVFGTQIAGLTGADGDLVSTVPVSAGLAGATFYTQGFVWDMTHTHRVLPGNVVEIRFIR